MSIEEYREKKILLAEAFVEEISSTGLLADLKDYDDVILIKKIKVLESVGLSHFWTADRILQYGDPNGSVNGASLVEVINSLNSIAARFVGKLALLGVDGVLFISKYMDNVIEEANVVNVAEASLFSKGYVYSRTASTPTLTATPSRVSFIKANLCLGVLHMALASGVCHEIIQKGK